MTQAKPTARTVEVELATPYDGWKATMKADGITARIFIKLQSNDVSEQMTAMASLVVAHNFLDSVGEPVESVLDAPIDALTAAIAKWSDAVAALPPR
jgi:hypothetical protein